MELRIVSGVIAFLTVFYLLNPAHEALLRLLEISGILLVTLLTFLVSKKLKATPELQSDTFSGTYLRSVSRLCNKGGFPSLRFIITALMLLLLVIIPPLLLKPVRWRSS